MAGCEHEALHSTQCIHRPPQNDALHKHPESELGASRPMAHVRVYWPCYAGPLS